SANWVDRIYLSDKETLGAPGETLWLLGDVARAGGLEAGESYTGTASFSLPPSTAGLFVHVVADAVVRSSDAVAEENEQNNVASGSAAVTNIPADLRVIAVSAAPAFSGEKTIVTWTVK